jgi:hypothetical protein
MANVQKQFEKFHQKIRFDYDMEETLREKREIILEKIRKGLARDGRPSFERLLQGSYAMKTGVKPLLEAHYDMDVGLHFDVDAEDTPAEEVLGWVWEYIHDHTDDVQRKGPCIRVTYADGFHVDLVMYGRREGEACVLAHRDRGWIPADPRGLLQYVQDATKRFDGTNGGTTIDQLRRVIRYLKRWDDENVPEDATHKLSGLAFTLLAIDHLEKRVRIDDRSPDDAKALEALARKLGDSEGRLVAHKPTPEKEDMLGVLSDSEMDALKRRFRQLANSVKHAIQSDSLVAACQELEAALGRDFPTPTEEEKAIATNAPAVVRTTSAA